MTENMTEKELQGIKMRVACFAPHVKERWQVQTIIKLLAEIEKLQAGYRGLWAASLMSKNISEIPKEELLNDLDESRQDIKTCQLALAVGVTTYSGGEVSERLRINQEIVTLIENELQVRERLNVKTN